MEQKALIEQDKQTLAESIVQTSENAMEKPKKKRTAEQKIGRHKVHELKTTKILSLEERILRELRWMRHKMERLKEVDYSAGDVEGWAVHDEVDREIVQRIREVGVPGVLPKVAAADLNQRGNFGLEYYDVSRRIVRMNKRLYDETGHYLFEKRGHAWALTKFAFNSYEEPEEEPVGSWPKTEEELENEKDSF
jgi:hypothetical protein